MAKNLNKIVTIKDGYTWQVSQNDDTFWTLHRFDWVAIMCDCFFHCVGIGSLLYRWEITRNNTTSSRSLSMLRLFSSCNFHLMYMRSYYGEDGIA